MSIGIAIVIHQAYLRDNGFLEFNQVPLLRIDGMNIVQTQAIVRYLARKHGLYGKTAKEDALYANIFRARVCPHDIT